MRGSLIIIAAALITGCSTSTPGCGSPPDLTGTWSYAGTQSGPTSAQLTGTLTLGRTGTCTVSGTLSLTIDDGTTPSTTGWTASGDFLDDSIFELDATQGGTDRHHLGTVVHGDSVAGNWVIPGSSTSGSFTMKRTGP